jgi:uncharacterized protein YceH (UPF0502 family)
MTDIDNALPELSPEEIRVLGSLLEKNKTTPDYYPMTLNALTAACNQKSSRKPVVEYEEQTVSQAISRLKALSLVATAIGSGTRTIKYKHNFSTVYPLNEASQAILCLLFLRGPQTPGELNTNAGRLHEFTSLESVLETLVTLQSANPPFVVELPKQAGQKEKRFAHCFGAIPCRGRDFSNNHNHVTASSTSEPRTTFAKGRGRTG